MGHSNSDLIKAYRAVVKKADAKRFWAIVPTPV
jgi:hypothetical protein